MAMYKHLGRTPVVGNDVFIAPSADIIGEVELKDNSNIWFQTVIRGDVAKITIGENVNIQDKCMLHVDRGHDLVVGNNTSVGHSVTLHACTVGESCLIGMGSIILDGAVIGDNSLVAAGSLVPPGKVFPPNSFIMGSPAKVKRELTEEEVRKYGNHYKAYIKYKNEYLDSESFSEI